MKKNPFLKIGIFGIFILILFLLVTYYVKEAIIKKDKANAEIRSIPLTKMFTLDSSAFRLSRSSAVVLIFFNSDCDHCKYELYELKKEIRLFRVVEIILLSSENISTIKRVSQEYGLDGFPNVHFAKINGDHVYATFGSLSIPHIFLYRNDSILIKEFKGETKMDAILKYLKE